MSSLLNNMNKNILVWNRVSTVSQNENFSLEMQEKMCRDFVNNVMGIKVIKRILNNTGSAYKPNNEMKRSYHTLYESENPIIICLSVDRFSRNVDYGTEIYNKIKGKGGRIFFILDNIDTSKNEKAFFEKLQQAEMESVIKSEKMKTCYKFTLNMKINKAREDLTDIISFIQSMIEGDEVEIIHSKIRNLVDWDVHQDWIEDWYVSPIEFDNEIFEKKGNRTVRKIVKGDITFETVATILNEFDIQIPIQKILNKKWSADLVQRVYESTQQNTMTDSDNISDLIGQLIL